MCEFVGPQFCSFNSWWANQDLNLGPSGYEPVALPTELLALIIIKKIYISVLMPGVNTLIIIRYKTRQSKVLKK